MWVTYRAAMLLKQKSLVLIFTAHVIIGAAGFVLESGSSPPQPLQLWGRGKNVERPARRSPAGVNPQRAQRRNANFPFRQQARPIYFDSHSPKRRRPANHEPPIFHQLQHRHRARNGPQQMRPPFVDSSLFEVEGGNYDLHYRYPPQVRAPFEDHEVIDARSPISKPVKQQHFSWEKQPESHGYDRRKEHGDGWFGGGGIQIDAHRGYQGQPSRSQDFKRTLNNGGHSKEVQQGRDHFIMKQNRAHGNNHEFNDYAPDFFLGESDYSHEVNLGENEEEVQYKSPFSDHGSSNDQIDQYYDFFGNKEAFDDNVQYYSYDADDEKKDNINNAPDFEADFSTDPNFSDEVTHIEDSHKFSKLDEHTPEKLGSSEAGFDTKFTNSGNPVRSLEALESQEYDNKKIKTIYRVSRQKDSDGIYPVITSVRTNIENFATPEDEVRKDQLSPEVTSGYERFEVAERAEREDKFEPRARKQNRKGKEMEQEEPAGEVHESRFSEQIENEQDNRKRIARNIENNHVPEYTKHRPELLHITDGVPTYTSDGHHKQTTYTSDGHHKQSTYTTDGHRKQTLVVENPPEVHQTIEVHHQHFPHNPDESIVSIQSPPEAFVEIPKFVSGVHDLAHFQVPPQLPDQQYLEVNIPKHVKVRKIRKGYIYELHLTEEEHLNQKEVPNYQYHSGHY